MSVLTPADTSPSRATDISQPQSSPTTPSTSSSPKTLLVPPSIPEHHELSSVADQHTQATSSSPSKAAVSSRRTSVAVPVRDETRVASVARSRRRSVPTVITSDIQSEMNVAKARRHSQQRITQLLSNFPKVNAASVSLCYTQIRFHVVTVIVYFQELLT